MNISTQRETQEQFSLARAVNERIRPRKRIRVEKT
jgi:hypothetical protein